MRIYDQYFAPKGVLGDAIAIEAKRSCSKSKDVNKDLYAKIYADGSKQRVAVLAVNKEVSISQIHTGLAKQKLTSAPHRSTTKPSKSSTPTPSSSKAPPPSWTSSLKPQPACVSS